MVCKINFDYEILLSDESESIFESDISDIESNMCKKFVLGDNILNVNPIEIISVRQLNDNISVEKVPMNYDIHFDEAISNLDEESVAESESEMYSDFATLQEKEFEYVKPFKYELPTVNRFQIDSQSSLEFGGNISQINKYCFDEKSRRIKMEIKEKEKCNKKSNQKINDQSTLIIKPEFKEMSEIFEKENLLSSEKLSNLPIDLLTEFINGEKSLFELSQIDDNNNKDQKKLKKPKRSRANKKVTKTTNRFADKIKCKTEPLIKIEMKKSTENLLEINPEFSFISNIFSESLSINNIQSLVHKPNENNNLENNNSKPKETFKVIKPTTKPIKNSKTSKYKENEITNSDKMFKKSDIKNKCQKKENYLDKSTNIGPNLNIYSIKDQEKNEQSYIETNDNPMKTLENKSNSPCQSELHFETKIYNECFNLTEDNIIPILCENKFYENQLCIFPSIDDCKDNRTSSTDSGFQDIDSNDINDETQSITHLTNKISGTINLNKESEFDLQMKSHHEISTRTCSPIQNLLNSYCFKFNFLNDSVLTSRNINGEKLSKCEQGNLSRSNAIQNQETFFEKDEIQLKPDFDDSVLNVASIKSENSHINVISMNESNCSDYSGNKNPIICNNTFASLNECDLGLNKDVYDETITIENTLITKEKNVDMVGYCNDYSPFKTNYYSLQSAISNKEEISQFLKYQWLKFCEKYTMYNHGLMIL